ncbi:glycogen synthase [Salinimicrobium soli]|uniref:glycogen synthase n=1 Tax=Salinimicrobium soli TaxID=1254399 RepID=UPI003AADDFF7
MKNFLFVASENDAIANCKVGGVGDVIRDVPRQISERGDRVHVVVPSYSRLHQNGKLVATLNITLKGEEQEAYLYEVKGKEEFDNITHYVVHHPEIKAGNLGGVYHHDEEPFFNDVVKYTIFCTAVAEAIKNDIFGELDIVHLHDWHSSMLLFLRRYHTEYSELKNLRFVYCIHNLALQGIRPFNNSYSSLHSWFPEVEFKEEELRDPRYRDCFNLMALGIRFADAVHTVSPSYKQDVLLPSDAPEFIGGEGLENDLKQADREDRFHGILNGSNYHTKEVKKGRLFPNIATTIFRQLQNETDRHKAEFLAHTGEKIVPYLKKRPKFISASVARLTEQKFYFFKRSPESLLNILDQLEEVGGIYVLLGTGAPDYEELLRKVSYQRKNFIFMNTQCEAVVNSIYRDSDLYFMPSLFEPCGISQMLAMRNGQPCLVHHTGGLKDTVQHVHTGFAFDGKTYDEKVYNMVESFKEALHLFENEKNTWKQIQVNARKMRFTWKKSVDEYYKLLYAFNGPEFKVA